MQLQWEAPGLSRQAIPSTALYAYDKDGLPANVGYIELESSQPVSNPRGFLLGYQLSGATPLGVDFQSDYRYTSDDPSTERNAILIPKDSSKGRIYFAVDPNTVTQDRNPVTVTISPTNYTTGSPITSGLTAEYFKGIHFEYDYSHGVSGIVDSNYRLYISGSDTFSGHLKILTEGNYTFHHASTAFNLFVSGLPVLNGGTIHLSEGVYGFSIDDSQWNERKNNLSWSSADLGIIEQRIPAYVAPPIQNPDTTRVESDIVFFSSYDGSIGGTHVGTNDYSVRWTGQIKAVSTGSYTFEVRVSPNDSATLWVNSQRVLTLKSPDDYTSNTASGNINLVQDQLYDIKLEYTTTTSPNTTSLNNLRLSWQTPGETRLHSIPSSALYSGHLDYVLADNSGHQVSNLGQNFTITDSGDYPAGLIFLDSHQHVISDINPLFAAAGNPTVFVKLGSKPATSSVSATLSYAGFNIKLIFTDTNWDQAQPVQLSGINSQSVLVHSKLSSIDSDYTLPVSLDTPLSVTEGQPAQALGQPSIRLLPVADAMEGSSQPGEFAIALDRPALSDMTMAYTLSGTAVAGTDYESLPGSVTIPKGATQAIIPVTALSDVVTELTESITLTLSDTSQALTAEYFDNATLTGTAKLTRLDPGINFIWGDKAPDPSLGADNFSVRWTGKLTAPNTASPNQLYTFTVRADEGVRLYIDNGNNSKVIDTWTSGSGGSGTYWLSRNQSYDIRLEYADKAGAANVQLLWSTKGMAQELIPASAFRPATQPSATIQLLDNNPAGVEVVNVSTSGSPAKTSYSSTLSELITSESGSSESFAVRLKSQPASNVTLTFGNGNTAEGLLSTSSLTFTPGNWNQFQTVSVTGVNDNKVDGPIDYSISTRVSSQDSNYGGNSEGKIYYVQADGKLVASPIGNIPVTNLDTTDTKQPFTDTPSNTSSLPTATVQLVGAASETENSTAVHNFTISLSQPAGTGGTTVYFSTDDSTAKLQPLSAFELLVPQSRIVGGQSVQRFSGPFDGVDVGSNSRPAFGDLDHDGDIDAVIGAADGKLKFFLNTGSSKLPHFIQLGDTDGSNPLALFNALPQSGGTTVAPIPTIADVNGDGLPDIFVKRAAPILLKNSPAGFSLSSSGSDFLNVTTTSILTSADLNRDGKADWISLGGTNKSSVIATTSATSSTTVMPASALTGTPVFADWNGDGKADLFVVQSSSILYYENTSTATSLNFLQADSKNPFAGLTLPSNPALSFADFDGNDTLDAVIGNNDGTLTYFKNAHGVKIAAGQSSANVGVGLVDNLVADGNKQVTLHLMTTPDNTQYQVGSTNNQASLAVTDNDSVGVIVTSAGSTSENGSQTGTVSVKLNSQPTANVNVYLGSNDSSEAGFGVDRTPTTLLTFTPSNWNVAQTATVYGVDDSIADGNVSYRLVTTVFSDDRAYEKLHVPDQTLINADNDTAGISITTIASNVGSNVDITDSLRVVLRTQPVNPVEVTLTPTDDQIHFDGKLPGQSLILTFTAENWNLAQAVRVAATDDNIYEPLRQSHIQFAVKSADSVYQSLNGSISPQAVTVADNDLPVVSIVPGYSAAEQSATPGYFIVTINGPAPESGLVVNYTLANTSVAGAATAGQDFRNLSGSVRIAPGESEAPIVLFPIDESLVESDETVTVQLSTDTAHYNVSSSANQTSLEIVDNDHAGVLLVEKGIATQVTESGDTTTFQLSLLSQPTSPVTVTLTSSVLSGHSQLGFGQDYATTHDYIFDKTNWFVPQTITVTAIDDALVEELLSPTQPYHNGSIDYHFSSTDAGYNNLETQTDSAGHSIFNYANGHQPVQVFDRQISLESARNGLDAMLETFKEKTGSAALPILGQLDGKLPGFTDELGQKIQTALGQLQSQYGDTVSAAILRDKLDDLVGGSHGATGPVTVSMDADKVMFNFGYNFEGSYSGNHYDSFSIPAGQEWGVAGLVNFKPSTPVTANFDSNFNLSFGFNNDKTSSFFADTANSRVETKVALDFSHQSTPFKATGQVGYLPVDLVNDPDTGEGTALNAGFTTTLVDTDSDNRLSTNELVNFATDHPDNVDYDFSGSSASNSAQLGFKVNTVNSNGAYPSLKYDLNAKSLPVINYNGEDTETTEVNVTDLSVDAGKLVTTMIKPYFNSLDKVIQPLKPLVDALNKDVTFIKEIGMDSIFDTDSNGKVTVAELVGVLTQTNLSALASFGQFLTDIDKQVSKLNQYTGSVKIMNYGDFTFSDVEVGGGLTDTNLHWSQTEDGQEQPETFDLIEEIKSGFTPTATYEAGDENGRAVSVSVSPGSISFDIFEAENLVKLAVGDREADSENPSKIEHANFIRVDLPKIALAAKIVKEHEFNPYPIKVGFEAGVEVATENLSFAYDSYGIEQWSQTNFDPKKTGLLWDGFYINDFNADGEDDPELVLKPGISVFAGVGKGIYLKATGGVKADVGLDILDVGELTDTNDGKLRGSEIKNNKISDLFHVSGEIAASFELAVEAGFTEEWAITLWSYELAKYVLAEFDSTKGIKYSGKTTLAGQDGSAINGSAITGGHVNEAPTALNLSDIQTYTEDTPLDLTDIIVSDVDSATVTAFLVLSNPAAGHLTTATEETATSTYNALVGAWIAEGTIAEVNALLADVQFVPIANFNSPLSITNIISDGTLSIDDTRTLLGAAVNDAPTFSSLAPVFTTHEDTPVSIQFSDLLDASNATDIDGTVSGFIVKSVTTGKLYIGASAATALPWNPRTNTIVDATHMAYWKPALDANGALAAFTVVAKDNSNAMSSSAIAVPVSVAAVNDAPKVTHWDTKATYIPNTPLKINDLVVSDNDSSNITIALSLSNPAAGSINTGTVHAVTSSYNPVMGTWIASGPIADVDALLAKLVLTPSNGFAENFGIRFFVSDGDAIVIDHKAIEATTGITLSNANVDENVAAGSLVGLLAAIGPNSDNAFTYTLSSGVADNGAFNIVNGNQLVIAKSPNFEAKSHYAIQISASDDSGTTFVRNVAVNINNLNEASNGSVSIKQGSSLPLFAVGEKLLASNTLADRDHIVSSIYYQWQTDGKNISGAMGNEYTLQPTDVGKTITVVASYLDGSGTYNSIASHSTPVALAAIRGTDSADTLNGTNHSEAIFGLSGDDNLFGNDANDWLDGGRGVDQMIGGRGNDTYLVDNTADKVVESAGAGIDTVYSPVSFTLPSHVEKLVFQGNYASTGTGNGLNNVITASSGSDTLYGLDGNDSLSGGSGNDIINGGRGNDVLRGGPGSDSFVFDTIPSITNSDVIFYFSAIDDKILLSKAIFNQFTTIGTVAADHFVVGDSAHDGNDYLIYNPDTGNVFYDADGNGIDTPVKITALGVHLAVESSDFMIIA